MRLLWAATNERRVEIHTVGYHPQKKLADSLNRLPDVSTTFEVSGTVGEPATLLFVRVYVPNNAVKGEYMANLVLRHSGSAINIPVTLTVFGFQLPVQSTFKTQVNLSLQKFQPNFLSSPIDKLDFAKQFLLEYRMTPKGVAWPSGLKPEISWDNTNSPGQCTVLYDEDDEALPYSAGKNTKRWVIGEGWKLRRWKLDANDPSCNDGTDCPESTRTSTGFSSNMLFQFPDNSHPRPSELCDISIGTDNFGTPAYNAEWSEFLAALDEYVSQNENLVEKSYIYVQNEPQNDQDAKLANHLCHIYKNAAPNLKIAISEEAKPDIAERTDAAPCGFDYWIAHVPAFDKEYAWERLENHGEESWFYSLPQDSGALFSPCEDDIGVNDGMNIRVIPWTAFVARIRGWAYYKMEIFFEGSQPMRPKIGAEIFRDAMEDYEYLFLANGGKHPLPNTAELVDPVAKAIGFSFTAWLRDHAKFAALRHELGRFIDGSRSTLASLPVENQGTTDPIYINFQDPDSNPTSDPLVIDDKKYRKIGWEPFDAAKGFGWSGHGFQEDGNPDDNLLLYDYQSGGANALEESYIYNDYGRENQFDYAVADGTWTVTIAVGYPQQSRSDVQDVTVNGVVFNDQPVVNVQYFTKDVEVVGGYLQIAYGKTFDTYCFVSHFSAIPKDVAPAGPGPSPTPDPPAPTDAGPAPAPPPPAPSAPGPGPSPTPDPPAPTDAGPSPEPPQPEPPTSVETSECGLLESILQMLFGWLVGLLFGFSFCEP